MKKRPILFLLLLLLGCSEKKESMQESNCVGQKFEQILLQNIFQGIEPAITDFGYQLKQTGDGGMIVFVPYWGDAFKFTNGGRFDWKVSFNSKSISNNQNKIEYLRGTTPDFDTYQDQIFFLQSDETIYVYSVNGKQTATYSVDIPGFYSDKIKVLNENQIVLSGTKMQDGIMCIMFFSVNLTSNEREYLGKFEIDPERIPYFVHLDSEKAFILGERDLFLTEFDLADKEFKRWDFSPAKNRDYEKYPIPSDVDYFSLSEQHRLQYKQDKTLRFVKRGNDLLILNLLAEKKDLSREPYHYLLTRHSLVSSEVKEWENVDWSLVFDPCGNVFQIAGNGGEGLIERKSLD